MRHPPRAAKKCGSAVDRPVSSVIIRIKKFKKNIKLGIII